MSRKEKKDWSLDALLSVVGFVFELVRVVVNALRRRDGTVDHLRRLLNEPTLVDKVFDLIVVKAEAALPLPPDHYSVFVPYGPIPSYAEMDKKLFDSSSELWDATKYALQSHKTCKDVDETPGNKEFWLPCLGEISSDEAIKKADTVGFRPPTFMEALAFAAAHPDLQRKFSIVILGCFVLYYQFRYVPVLSSNDGRRGLDRRWFDYGWDADYRFLFVRK